MATLPHRTAGAGPHAVLIHGTAPDLFDALEAELRLDLTLVRYDRRGFRGSGAAPAGALRPHAQDVVQILEERSVPRALLVGWSIGGIIALEAALQAPEHVAGLVLVEPPWLLKQHPSVRMLAGILGGKLRGALGAPGAGGERFLRWALSRRDGSSDFDHAPSDYLARVRENGAAMLRELDGGTGEHLRSLVTGPLTIPVSLLVGTESTPEFAAGAQRLCALLCVEPQIVEGAGHAMQHTHAREVAAHVRRVAARAFPERSEPLSGTA